MTALSPRRHPSRLRGVAFELFKHYAPILKIISILWLILALFMLVPLVTFRVTIELKPWHGPPGDFDRRDPADAHVLETIVLETITWKNWLGNADLETLERLYL